MIVGHVLTLLDQLDGLTKFAVLIGNKMLFYFSSLNSLLILSVVVLRNM